MNTTALLILGIPLLCLVIGLLALVVWASETISVSSKKRDTWPAFARAIGAEFINARSGKPDQVKSMLGEWPFVMDTNVVGTGRMLIEYTRLRAYYPPRKAFEAVLCTRDSETEVPPAPYLSVVPSEVLGLDEKVIATTNDLALLKALLEDHELARLVRSIAPLNLQIRRRHATQSAGPSDSVYEVYVQQRGIIADQDRLLRLYELVKACHSQLLAIGAAGHTFAERA